MHIYIGSDHGGFKQKEALIKHFQEKGQTCTDCGTYSSESTDYPDFAVAVGNAIHEHPKAVGILLCRSGEGMEIAVNKVPGVRGALVWRNDIAKETRNDNDANVLVLPSDFIDEATALEIADTFIATPFSGEIRHIRRIEKIQQIEHMRHDS